jgi:hypothetical protein
MRAAVLISVGVLSLVACDQPRTPTTPGNVQNTVPPSATPPPAAPPGVGANVEQYVLTLSVDNCAVIPESDRTRTYSATIQETAPFRSIVTLGDGQFLSGLICTAASGRFSGIGCNQFFAADDIDTVSFFLENNNDEAHGGHIVERLPSGGWWEITGGAGGLRTAQSIDAFGKASIWYCPSPLTYPFPCSTFTSCRSADLRLRFTRR